MVRVVVGFILYNSRKYTAVCRKYTAVCRKYTAVCRKYTAVCRIRYGAQPYSSIVNAQLGTPPVDVLSWYSLPELHFPLQNPYLWELFPGGGPSGCPWTVPRLQFASCLGQEITKPLVDMLYTLLHKLPLWCPFLALCMPRFSSVAWLPRGTR